MNGETAAAPLPDRQQPAHAGRSTRLRRRPPVWRSATTLRRLLALVVDLSAGLGVTALLFAAGLYHLPAWLAPTESMPVLERAAIQAATVPLAWYNLVIGLLVPWCALLLVVCATTGRSLGQWVSGLRLVDADGQPADLLQRIVWALCHLAWPASLGLLAWASFVSRSRRGIAERLSRTWCVQSPPRTQAPDA